jgi:hypothetical protein
MRGIEGPGGGRQAKQAKMMAAWLLFGRAGTHGYIFYYLES